MKQIKFLLLLIVYLLWPTEVASQEKIVLQLRWDHQFQFAGYYAAQWQGYYAEEGLEVEIRPALTEDGEILSAVEEVAAGRADFGIGAADVLIANDQDADLSVVATIFQQSAAAFYLKEETPFTSLADLTRLRVARRENDLIDVELQTMLLNEGIDLQKITPYPHQPGVEHLLDDWVQVVPGYKTTVPFFQDTHKVKFKEIRPFDYGVDFYGDSIFTTYDLTQTDPELVERFVRASKKGWVYALEHPEEIAVEISKNLERYEKLEDTQAFNLFQADAVKELTLYPIVEIGNINPYRWERMHALMKEIGQVENDLDLDKFIFDSEKIQSERHVFLGQIAIWTLLLGGIVFVSVIVWSTSLKRQVNQRTAALQQELSLRKQTEKTLRESEKLMLTVAANYPNSYISIIEKDWTVGFTSGQEFKKQNLDPNSFVGLTIEEVFGEQAGIVKEHYQKTFAGQEEIFELSNNNQHQLYYAIPLPNENGEIEQILAVVENITERVHAEKFLRESEELHRITIENISDPVFITDEAGQFTYICSNVTHILGYSTAEVQTLGNISNLIGENLFDLELLETRGEIKNIEAVISDKGGKEKNYLVSVKRVSIKGGTILYTCHDVTERKQAEQALQEYSERLEEMVNERTKELREVQEQLVRKEKLAVLGELASGVAHELRNPLGVLSNAVYFLNMTLTDATEKTKEYLDIIDTEVRKSEKIVTDLLGFSRTRLTEKIEREEVAVSMLVTRVLAQHPPPEQIEVSTQFDPNLPPTWVNPQQIEQVLTNIITNAYQAMPDEGEVTINATLQENEVAIFVRDTGRGIPAENLKKIFEPLFTTKTKGIGLGLAVSKNLLEANGGRIDVESKESKGSTFIVTLPAQVTNDDN